MTTSQNPLPHSPPSESIRSETSASPASERTTRPTRWQRFKFVFKVLEVRVRFIAILIAIGLLVGYWDAIKNHWEKQTRADGGLFRTVRFVLGHRTAEWIWPQPTASGIDVDSEYYCPMHPSVVRAGMDPNGAIPKCPICGMPLSLRKKGEAATLPEGILSRKQFSPDQIRLAGIQTVEAAFRPLSHQITAVGNVNYDESRRSRIVSRVAGYLEKLYVDKPWVTVREGEVLGEIYSPRLYSASQELLLAQGNKVAFDLESVAREKLRLLGVSDTEIDQLKKSGKANHRLVLRSPRAGHVISKEVLEGGHVEEGQTLFEIADLSKVWIEAEVYESDISFIQEGQSVEAMVEAFPNRVFAGTVALVHPHVEPATRTNAVRFVLDNPDHSLRPGMFATVRIKTPIHKVEPLFSNGAEERPMTSPVGQSAEVLTVPERSVIDTGSKKIVYVERQQGMFEGVEVQLGPRSEGFYPVIKGIKAGDRVAAAGSFLIDAETRLNPAASSTYLGASGGPSNGKTGSPVASASSSGTLQQPSVDDLANIEKLAGNDRSVARAQRFCPITSAPLGSMGVPVKLTVNGQSIFLCCAGCESKAKQSPDQTLKKLTELKSQK